MSDPAGQPPEDLSTWTIDRLQSRTEDPDHQGPELERVRVIAAAHAYNADEQLRARLDWAKLSLQANARMHGDAPWERERMASNNFMLRTWIIDQLSPDPDDPDWSPESLAADTLAALTLDPAEARDLAANWRDRPRDQIGELRRHKNMTAHLAMLVNHLQPGAVLGRLLSWVEVRQHLP